MAFMYSGGAHKLTTLCSGLLELEVRTKVDGRARLWECKTQLRRLNFGVQRDMLKYLNAMSDVPLPLLQVATPLLADAVGGLQLDLSNYRLLKQYLCKLNRTAPGVRIRLIIRAQLSAAERVTLMEIGSFLSGLVIAYHERSYIKKLFSQLKQMTRLQALVLYSTRPLALKARVLETFLREQTPHLKEIELRLSLDYTSPSPLQTAAAIGTLLTNVCGLAICECNQNTEQIVACLKRATTIAIFPSVDQNRPPLCLRRAQLHHCLRRLGLEAVTCVWQNIAGKCPNVTDFSIANSTLLFSNDMTMRKLRLSRLMLNFDTVLKPEEQPFVRDMVVDKIAELTVRSTRQARIEAQDWLNCPDFLLGCTLRMYLDRDVIYETGKSSIRRITLWLKQFISATYYT